MSILDNGIQNSLLKQKNIDANLAGHIVESMVDFDFRMLCEKENFKQYYFGISGDFGLTRQIKGVKSSVNTCQFTLGYNF